MITGVPPTSLDRRQHVLLVAHKGGLGDADAVPAEDLERAQLVARDRDGVRRVQREDAHLLELAHHRTAEEGDRGANPGNHRVVMRHVPAVVGQAGLFFFHVNREKVRIQNLDLMASRNGRFAQPARRIEPRPSREDRYLHKSLSQLLPIERSNPFRPAHSPARPVRNDVSSSLAESCAAGHIRNNTAGQGSLFRDPNVHDRVSTVDERVDRLSDHQARMRRTHHHFAFLKRVGDLADGLSFPHMIPYGSG